MPMEEKLHCPKCGQMSAVGNISIGSLEMGTCPYCQHQWNQAQQTGQDAATAAMISATSKPCPNCGLPITHYHGHDCHHISPGTGCPSCKQHFCYVCLRKHGTPGHRVWNTACEHKQSFCMSNGIKANLVLQP